MFLIDIPCEMAEVVTSCVVSIVGQNYFAVSEHLLFVSNRSVSQSGCVAMRQPMTSHPNTKRMQCTLEISSYSEHAVSH